MNLKNEINKYLFYNNISLNSILHLTFSKKDRELKYLRKLLKKNQIAIDIGANIGTYIYELSKVIKENQIFALEPLESNSNIIKKFFSNSHIFNIALSDKEGIAQLKIPIINSNEVTTRGTLESFTDIGETGSKIVQVKKTTLDTFVKEHNLNNIGFIKIDVEGHEFKVLKGAEETLKTQIPNLIIEIEQRHHNNSIYEIFNYLKELGYKGQYIDPRWNTLENIESFNISKYQSMDKFKTNEYVNNFIFSSNYI